MEYPKMLYRGGDATADFVIVDDEAGEKAARSDGYAVIGEAEAPARKRKAAE